MPHIWSDDVDEGATFDGVWDLNTQMHDESTLRYHFVDDSAPIPWIYPGADGLVFYDGGSNGTVSFGTIATAKEDPDTRLALQNALNAGLPGGITCVVVHVPALQAFDVTFTAMVAILWADALSTSVGVWGGRDFEETALSMSHLLSDRFAEPRPDVMEVELDEVYPLGSSRPSVATFYIPLQDHQVSFSFFIRELSFRIALRWRRVNIHEVSCPMTNQWHLWFE